MGEPAGTSPFGDDEAAKARAVHDVVQVASIAAAAVAVQPLPFVDLVVVTPIHVAMVQQIGRIRGFEIDGKSVLEILSSIGATSKHSLEDIKTLMAGRVVSAGTQVGGDAFIATGATTPADLEAQMKLSAAYLTDPGFRPEAAGQWANAVPVLDKQFTAQPQSVFQTKVPALIAGGDWRFGIPDAAVLSRRSFDEARTPSGKRSQLRPAGSGWRTIVPTCNRRGCLTAPVPRIARQPPTRPDGQADPPSRDRRDPVAVVEGAERRPEDDARRGAASARREARRGARRDPRRAPPDHRARPSRCGGQ